MLRISELRNKDVINGQDGRRIGFIRDIDIDLARGCIDAVVIPGDSRFFSLFGKNDETVLTWRQIKKIGVDVILVEPDKYQPINILDREKEKTKAVDDAYANDNFLNS